MGGPRRTENWGLANCRPDLECSVCAKLADQPTEMQRLRDCYCENISELVLVKMFDIPFQDLHQHCWRHGWPRRRRWNQPTMKQAVTRLLWARLAKGWNVVAPTTGDTMLSLLLDLNFR